MKILNVKRCKHPNGFPVKMSSSNQWLSEQFLPGFSDKWKANQYTSPNHKCSSLT